MYTVLCSLIKMQMLFPAVEHFAALRSNLVELTIKVGFHHSGKLGLLVLRQVGNQMAKYDLKGTTGIGVGSATLEGQFRVLASDRSDFGEGHFIHLVSFGSSAIPTLTLTTFIRGFSMYVPARSTRFIVNRI